MKFFRVKNDKTEFWVNLSKVVSISIHNKGDCGYLEIDLESKNMGCSEPWKVPVDLETQERFQTLFG